MLMIHQERTDALKSDRMLGMSSSHRGLTQAASQREPRLKQRCLSSWGFWVSALQSALPALRGQYFHHSFLLTTLVHHLRLLSVPGINHFYILGHLCLVFKSRITSPFATCVVDSPSLSFLICKLSVTLPTISLPSILCLAEFPVPYS